MTKASATRSNIAGAINAAHAGVESAKHEGARYATECGKLLIEAKETVAHGSWDSWLRANTAVSPRTAQLYMRIARHVEGDPAKAQRVAGLSLRKAAAEAAVVKRPTSKPLSPEGEAWVTELKNLWNEARPEWREMFAREIHHRGDVTIEQRDCMIAAAYRDLGSAAREAAGERLARLLSKDRPAADLTAILPTMKRFCGTAPAISLGDAISR